MPNPGELLGECTPELAVGLFEDESAFKVLVLRFHGATDKDREFGQKVSGTLRASLEEYLEEESKTEAGKRAGVQPERFEVRRVGCSVASHGAARKVGTAWQADLVLWGRASCELGSAKECRTVELVHSDVTTTHGDVNIGVTPFRGSYVPSATMLRGLSLHVRADEGTQVGGSESAEMVEWEFPRVATSKPTALLHLMVGLEAFARPDYVAAAAHLERAETDLGASEEAAQRLLNAMTVAYLQAGLPAKAVERATKRVDLCGADPACQGAALTALGWVRSRLGDPQRALERFEQALRLRRQVGDVSGEAATLLNMGAARSDLGDTQRALELLEQALALLRQVGDVSGEAVALDNMGVVQFARGDKQRALELFEQALRLRRQVGDVSGEATTLTNLGSVRSALGDKQRALELYDQALPLFRQVGDVHGEANSLSNLGKVWSDLGDDRRALELLALALRLNRQVGDVSGEATTLHNQGLAQLALGDKQRALELLVQALRLDRQVGDVSAEAHTLRNMGAVQFALGDKPRALALVQQACDILDPLNDVWSLASCRIHEAALLAELGDLIDAVDSWMLAFDLYMEREPPAQKAAFDVTLRAWRKLLDAGDNDRGHAFLDALSARGLQSVSFFRIAAVHDAKDDVLDEPRALLALDWIISWPGAERHDRVAARALRERIAHRAELPEAGLVVATEILPDSQAMRAGIPEGAILLRYADTRLTDPESVIDAVKRCAEDEGCSTPVMRWWTEGQTHSARMTPGQIGVRLTSAW